MPGDKLISCHGLVLIYKGKNSYPTSDIYPHLVEYPDVKDCFGTRTDDGKVAKFKPLPTDHDIVGFYQGEIV
jgi:hypothetical protein